MDHPSSPGAAEVLNQAVAAGVVPGAALAVVGPDGPLLLHHVGQAELRPRPRPVQADTAWDLASLTKILATTPLALALAEDGLIDLDRPLRELLPDAPEGVSARHCLQHSSGLPAWSPLFEQVVADRRSWGTEPLRAWLMRRARTIPVRASPGQVHTYSDLGFLLLGAALEAAAGDRLDRLWEQRIRAAMGQDLRWGWPGAAATEDCPERGRVLVGEVHDLNAAVMGGLAPHAGLFGDALAVASAGAWFLACGRGEAGGLRPETIRRAFGEEGPGSHRLGFDSRSPEGSSAGRHWPLDGVGHLGFTGTSLWLAPTQGIAVALCTNRVHPEVEGGARPGQPPGPRTLAFRALRPAVHEAVVEQMQRDGSWSGLLSLRSSYR